MTISLNEFILTMLGSMIHLMSTIDDRLQSPFQPSPVYPICRTDLNCIILYPLYILRKEVKLWKYSRAGKNYRVDKAVTS